MGMPHNLEDVDFSADSLNIIDVGYLVLLQNFDGDLRNEGFRHFKFIIKSTYLLFGVDVDSLFYFSEGTLAKCLGDSVIANNDFFSSFNRRLILLNFFFFLFVFLLVLHCSS